MANKKKHLKPTNDDVRTAEKIYNEGKRAAEAELIELRRQLDDSRADIDVAAKIRMKDADEAQARFLRVMFLRQTKERLKKGGAWAEFCRKNEIDLKNADYEIAKLGELKDEFLLKFGSAVGFEINKIKYITGGDSEKLGVEVRGKDLFYQGEKVPLSDAPAIISAIHDELRKERDEAAKDKRALQRNLADRDKKIHSLTREADDLEAKLQTRAKAREITPEEDQLTALMGERRTSFEGYMLTIEPESIELLQTYGKRDEEGVLLPTSVTPLMRAAYLSTLDFMRRRIVAAYDTAVEMYGHDMSPEAEWRQPV